MNLAPSANTHNRPQSEADLRELMQLLEDIGDQRVNHNASQRVSIDSYSTWVSTLVIALFAAFIGFRLCGGPAKQMRSDGKIRQRRESYLARSLGPAPSYGESLSDPKPKAPPIEVPATAKQTCNKPKLTEATIQETRRRWKREQVTKRFSDVGSPCSKSKSGNNAIAAKRAPAKAKKEKKIELPAPDRFLPKAAPETPIEPALLTCHPTNTGVADTTGPNSSAETSAGAQRIQTALLAALKAARSAPTTNNQTKRKDNDAVVVRDGITRFLNVPDLPNADHTSFLLKRLAREFLPIVKRRGYNILLVSEMCCCTDGSKAARGEVRNHSRIKVHTSSGSEDQCGGYNRTIRLSKDETINQIFIRLRDRRNHYKFRTYKEIARTMAHELAHCEHQNHGADFQLLMKEIQMEHDELVLSGEGNQRNEESAEEQFGFDIYGSSTSRTTF